MCGVSGFFDFRGSTDRARLASIGREMAATLAHRGPDGEGVWVDEAAGIALGHRRLAIVDLSAAGHQPMASSNGRFVISYNGEIYNSAELRTELAARGHVFRGHSDTETLVEGCAAWGVEACVRKLIGMFAFAAWDRRTRTLTLVRDRLGIKPLYWGCFGSFALFGSELKALRACPGWTPEIDRHALTGLLRYSCIAAPRSIYRGVSKLLPGSLLELRSGGSPKLLRYWDARSIVATRQSSGGLDAIGDQEAVDRLDALLGDAVRRRLVADVPLGAFLSGGVDSSVVAALMQSGSSRPVKTFSIGFRETGFDEAEHARAVAGHLATDHTELYVEPRHALEVIPQLPEVFDEPFSDASQIPTLLLAKLTARHVTVALSGDGGDELFGGYRRYHRARWLWRRLSLLPPRPRRLLAAMIAGPARPTWDRALARLGPMGGGWTGQRLHTLGETLALPTAEALYRQRVSHWQHPEEVVLDGMEPDGVFRDEGVLSATPDFLERMRLIDAVSYLPDDILTKVDRATMAASLEARVPIIDHRVFEFAFQLPHRMIVRGGVGKWLLRRVLLRYVPAALTERPKMGFAVPIGDWLRGPLRDWAEDLLDEARLHGEGFLDPKPVRERWRQHLQGRHSWSAQLWDVLMFQAWLRRHAQLHEVRYLAPTVGRADRTAVPLEPAASMPGVGFRAG